MKPSKAHLLSAQTPICICCTVVDSWVKRMLQNYHLSVSFTRGCKVSALLAVTTCVFAIGPEWSISGFRAGCMAGWQSGDVLYLKGLQHGSLAP